MDKQQIEQLIEEMYSVIEIYNFGSDSPRLRFKDGYLVYCSSWYHWIRVFIGERPTKEDVIKGMIHILLADYTEYYEYVERI